MPRLSTRAIEMPESPIRKLVPYADLAKEKGRKVYHLNIGQPDIKTPKTAIDAIQNNNVDILAYSHSAGFLSLREKLVKYYQSNQIPMDLENVMVTTGGSEAILFILNCIANMGDEIIIPEPFYANYNGFSVSAGINIVPIPSDIKSGFALPDISFFKEKITPKTKAILICNPNNPTGYLYAKEELNKLKELVLEHDLYLIADEVYREFVYGEHEHYSILQDSDLKENAIVIDSVSKRFSMCGARIGCIISKNHDIMSSALKFAQARLSPPTYAQIASEAALDVDSSYYTDVNEEYKNRRDLLVEGLNSIEGVFCPKPNGAFYCMASLPVKSSDHFAQWLLESYHYNNETVMVAPASGFYKSEGLGENEIRVAYVLNENDLKQSIEILRNALNEYKQSHG